jgi:hypothetical protein
MMMMMMRMYIWRQAIYGSGRQVYVAGGKSME